MGETFEHVFLMIAGVLLLPRQWIAAALALGIAGLIGGLRRWRARAPHS